MAAVAARSCALQVSSQVRSSVVDSKLENPATARLIAQPRKKANLTYRRDVTVAATPLVDTFTDFFKQLTAGAAKNAKDETSETVESLLALVGHGDCRVGERQRYSFCTFVALVAVM